MWYLGIIDHLSTCGDLEISSGEAELGEMVKICSKRILDSTEVNKQRGACNSDWEVHID
jgi:hypothetical protein